MILETIRAVTDFLGDSTYGVNAQLAGMTYDGTDTAPAPIVTLLDETRSTAVSLKRHPTSTGDLPALQVLLDPQGIVALQEEVINNTRNGDIPILIWCLLKNNDTAEGKRDTYYYLQAVERCLRDFLRNDAGATSRVRNNIHIIDCTSMTHVPVNGEVGDLKVTCGLLASFKVRDTQP